MSLTRRETARIPRLCRKALVNCTCGRYNYQSRPAFYARLYPPPELSTPEGVGCYANFSVRTLTGFRGTIARPICATPGPVGGRPCRWYLARHGLANGGDCFDDLVRRAGYDQAARQALQAHRQARMVALNAEAKITHVADLLTRHRDDRVLISAEYTALVDAISRRLLVPAITHRTGPRERRALLEGFRGGRYSKLVTGRVLNEGVDLPDADVAVVASGSSATREYIQRLGRVLRPKPRTSALYELITRKTSEAQASRRRRPQVLETLLCSAPESHFALRGDRKLVEAVAARHAVQVSVDVATVTLRGRPDACGWRGRP
jgi:hypothetical protein